PLSWTLGHVSPLCRTVEDAAVMLGVIAGYDELDSSSSEASVPDYSSALKVSTSKLRLVIPRIPFFDGLDSEIAKSVDVASEVLRKLTASIHETELPSSGMTVDEIYKKVRSAEAY